MLRHADRPAPSCVAGSRATSYLSIIPAARVTLHSGPAPAEQVRPPDGREDIPAVGEEYLLL